MATEFQSFSGGTQNPFIAPTGWTIYGDWERVDWAGSGEIYGDNLGQMVFDTYSSGLKTISAPMRHNGTSSNSEWGFCFINGSRTGFSLIVKNGSTTLRKEVAGSGGTTIATISTTNTTDVIFSVDYNDTTGDIVVKKAGSTVLTGTYNTNYRGKRGSQIYKP